MSKAWTSQLIKAYLWSTSNGEASLIVNGGQQQGTSRRVAKT